MIINKCKAHINKQSKWICNKCKVELCSDCEPIAFQNKIFCKKCDEHIVVNQVDLLKNKIETADNASIFLNRAFVFVIAVLSLCYSLVISQVVLYGFTPYLIGRLIGSWGAIFLISYLVYMVARGQLMTSVKKNMFKFVRGFLVYFLIFILLIISRFFT